MKLQINTLNLEYGKTYSIISNITRLDRVWYKSNPTIKSKYITGPLNLGIFDKRKKTVLKLLDEYGFTYDEIIEIVERLSVSSDTDTLNLPAKTRASLLVEIQFKCNDIIIINIPGYSYLTARYIYQQLFNKIRNTPKIGLLLEYSDKDIFEIKEVDRELIDKYETWIKLMTG